MGFEPTAFPVLPGRAHELGDKPSILLSLDVTLPAHRFAPRHILLAVNQLPWPTVLEGFRVVRLMVFDAFFQTFGLANIVPTRAFTLKDV